MLKTILVERKLFNQNCKFKFELKEGYSISAIIEFKNGEIKRLIYNGR
jgi:hypothetical protein